MTTPFDTSAQPPSMDKENHPPPNENIGTAGSPTNLSTPLTEKEKRAQILIKALEMYQTIISAERNTEQKIHEREPTLRELRTAMYNHYKAMQISRA